MIKMGIRAALKYALGKNTTGLGLASAKNFKSQFYIGKVLNF